MSHSSLEINSLGKGGVAVFSCAESFAVPPPSSILMIVEADDLHLAENFVKGMLGRDKFFTGHIREMDFAKGVAWLRSVILERDDYRCVKCTRTVKWRGQGAGEMHERITRGQGGTRNIFNCETLCMDCHTGSRGEHGLGARKKSKRQPGALSRN